MSGLLDKATDLVTENDENTLEAPIPVEEKSGLLSQAEGVVDEPDKSAPSSTEGSPLLVGVGALLLLISMVGFYNLRILPGILVLCVFISSYAAFTYGLKTWKGEISTDKFVTIGVAWILLGIAPYLAAFDFTAIGNLAVSEIAIDEDNDQLEFYIYTSSGDDIEVSVEFDGVEVWNSSVKAVSGKKKVEVPLADCYRGNALDGAGNTLHSYTIIASVGGTSDESPVPSDLMTRTAQDAGGELYTVSEYDDDTGTKEHYGVILSANIGLIHPSKTRETGGDTNKYSTQIVPIMGDYTFSFNITFDGTTVYSSTSVAVDGEIATWPGGSSDISTGWVTLDGTATRAVGGIDTSYLDRDDFYQGDGCYTMEFTVTNDLWHSSMGENKLIDDNAAYEFFWDYNEDEDRTGSYKNAVEC